MTDHYNLSDITVNDALAVLLGQSVWKVRQEGIDLLAYYEKRLADYSWVLEEVQKTGDEAEIAACERAADAADREYDLVGKLYTRLTGEIVKARKSKPTPIEIIRDDSGEGYEKVTMARQSVLDWAVDNNIKVGGSAPPPTRSHTTPLLDLLDELVREFWEDYDIDNPPKNDAIKAYVKSEHGDWKKASKNAPSDCAIPGVSEKVLDAMCTMMRPTEVKGNAK